MTQFDEPLDRLRMRIDELQTLPADQAARAWKTLADQVDLICKHIERSDTTTANATLPALSEIIRQLEWVISEMEYAQSQEKHGTP